MISPANQQGLTLWLIDDERDIYSAMLNGLRSERSVRLLRWFPECTQAIDSAPFEPPPDVILLDLNLTITNGIDMLPLLMAALPASRVLILTVDRRVHLVKQAMAAGAGGFLLKPFRMDEVLVACRRVLTGGIPIDPDMTAQLLWQLPHPSRSIGEFGLTAMEQSVARRIATGQTNKEIASELSIGIETVKSHCARVLGKMGVRSRTQLVVRMMREKLV